MLRLIRRPAYPGELNHELVWPAAFLAGAVFAWGWFLAGLQLPQCVFIRLTGRYGELAPTVVERLLTRDRAAFRASLERILAWPFARVIVADIA